MVRRMITSAMEALREQPLAFALVAINLMFVGAGAVVLREVASNIRAERETRNSLLTQCIDLLKKEK